MPSVTFRFDASPAIGGGHAVRCLALAESFRAAGWECRLAIGPGTAETVPAIAAAPHALVPLDGGPDTELQRLAAAGPADLLVIDHYRRDAAHERACRTWARRVLAIDDLADRPHDCDILLDATPDRRAEDYAGLVPAACRLLLGPRFAPLRPGFAVHRAAAMARRRAGAPVMRVLVAFGMTDAPDLTGRALTAAAAALPGAAIDIVLGPAAPHLAAVRARAAAADRVRLHVDPPGLAGVMAAADIALGAAGSASWERCALGLPALVAVLAGNQAVIAGRLAAAGAAIDLGWHEDVTAAAIAAALAALARDPAARLAMAESAAMLCDGAGAARVVEACR